MANGGRFQPELFLDRDITSIGDNATYTRLKAEFPHDQPQKCNGLTLKATCHRLAVITRFGIFWASCLAASVCSVLKYKLRFKHIRGVRFPPPTVQFLESCEIDTELITFREGLRA